MNLHLCQSGTRKSKKQNQKRKPIPLRHSKLYRQYSQRLNCLRWPLVAADGLHVDEELVPITQSEVTAVREPPPPPPPSPAGSSPHTRESLSEAELFKRSHFSSRNIGQNSEIVFNVTMAAGETKKNYWRVYWKRNREHHLIYTGTLAEALLVSLETQNCLNLKVCNLNKQQAETVAWKNTAKIAPFLLLMLQNTAPI